METSKQTTGDICLIGVGGAARRVVSRAALELPGDVSVAVVDTDSHGLTEFSAGTKVQIGVQRTGGRGCGGDIGCGRLAVEDEIGTIRALFKNRRLVVVYAALGGGTGSGAAAAVMREAHTAGAVTIGAVSTPFGFEGSGRLARAEEALEGIKQAADAVVLVPNDRLFDAVGAADVAETFEKADTVLGQSLAALCNMFARPGYIQLDLGDLLSMARHTDACWSLGYGHGTGKKRAEQALEQLQASSLLEGGQLMKDAACMMIGIVGSRDLRLVEVETLMSGIAGACPESCQMVMGTTLNDDERNSVTVCALVTGVWREQTAPAVAPELPKSRSQRRSRKKSGQVQLQPLLGLDMSGRDRFKDVDATIIDGEDLDIPTYLRRGIKLDK